MLKRKSLINSSHSLLYWLLSLFRFFFYSATPTTACILTVDSSLLVPLTKKNTNHHQLLMRRMEERGMKVEEFPTSGCKHPSRFVNWKFCAYSSACECKKRNQVCLFNPQQEYARPNGNFNIFLSINRFDDHEILKGNDQRSYCAFLPNWDQLEN